jgi:transcriptional regulator with XRE-family HTH domain
MNIFDYTDYAPFINETLKKRAAVLGSMSEVAQSLGYKNSSLLSMIISGKRRPSVDFIQRFSDHFNLSIAEKNDLEEKLWGNHLDKKEEGLEEIYLDANLCQGLTQWSFLYILNLLSLKGTPVDTKDLAEHLDCEEDAVKKTIKDILVLRLLRQDESGRLGPKAIFKLSPKSDSFKKDMVESDFISLALRKLRNTRVRDFFMGGEIINIEESRLEEAQKELRDFMTSFQKKYYHNQPGVMHRLSMQLFRL